MTLVVSLALCLSAVPLGSAAWAQTAPPPVASAAGILVDAESGKILWTKDDRSMRAPASLTKILTALVVLENAKLESKVTITPQARAARGSRTYAEAGWTFTVRDLLYGLLLPSGNDAALALAQAVSPDGTVEGFMRLANRRAAELGALSTHFTNPHGLDEPGHLTSARDMALISATAMKNPTFASIVGSRRHTVPWGDGSRRLFQNHNKLLARDPGAVGVKTGYTANARHTLVSAIRRGGKTLLAVTLGSPKQYVDSVALLDWGFANLSALQAAADEEIWPPKTTAPQPVDGGKGPGLVGDVLRLVQSLGGASPRPAPLPVPVVALSSLMGGLMAFAGFSALKQRRYRQNLVPINVAAFEAPAKAEVPYVSR